VPSCLLMTHSSPLVPVSIFCHCTIALPKDATSFKFTTCTATKSNPITCWRHDKNGLERSSFLIVWTLGFRWVCSLASCSKPTPSPLLKISVPSGCRSIRVQGTNTTSLLKSTRRCHCKCLGTHELHVHLCPPRDCPRFDTPRRQCFQH
jgi:hypothetical protein